MSIKHIKKLKTINSSTEDALTEKTDSQGRIWKKAYFGSGLHFQNWLEQFIEIYGKENIEVEEVKNCQLECYKNSEEKPYRIWTLEEDTPKK